MVSLTCHYTNLSRLERSVRPSVLCRTFWAPVRHFPQLMTGKSYQWSFLLLGWRCSFPSRNFILIPPSISNFITKSRSEILFYPNPEHEFEFHPILTRVYFILSPIFKFYPLIPTKNKFYPFIQKLHRHPMLSLSDILCLLNPAGQNVQQGLSSLADISRSLPDRSSIFCDPWKMPI